MLGNPCCVFNGVVNVIDEDLAAAGSPFRKSIAPFDKPTIVRLNASASVRVVLGFGRAGEQHKTREERGNRIWKHDLCNDAVLFLLAVAQFIVLVPQLSNIAKVTEWVAVFAAPCVEIITKLRIEELSILFVAATSVTIAGNDRVTIRWS